MSTARCGSGGRSQLGHQIGEAVAGALWSRASTSRALLVVYKCFDPSWGFVKPFFLVIVVFSIFSRYTVATDRNMWDRRAFAKYMTTDENGNIRRI